jgi:hypothetical protein
LRRLGGVALVLIPEAFTTFGLLATVALGQHLLKWWIGEDARFFGHLKVSWVFDVGDLFVISRFIWESIRKLR